MSTRLPVFNFKNVNITWGDVYFYDLADDAVSITANSEISSTVTGADGVPNISILADRTADITINLEQLSPTNLILAGLVEDLFWGGGEFPVADMTFFDPSGSVPLIARATYFKNTPDFALGSSVDGKQRSWMFTCEELVLTTSPAGLAEANVTLLDEQVQSAKDVFAKIRSFGS